MKNNEDTMTFDINLDSIAFRSIYEQRACPPDELLFSSDRSEELEAHLGYCRYCNERLELSEEDRACWAQLAERLKRIFVPGSDSVIPEPDQIWSLDHITLSGWGPYSRFYSPPLVLVLQLQDGGRTVRVAQICSEDALMGNDGAEIRLSSEVGFAEAWNVYSVHREHLGEFRGKVDASLTRQVLSQAQNLPIQTRQTPIIRKFRELETQVAAFIATQALSKVMEEVEQSSDLDKHLQLISKIAATERQKSSKDWNPIKSGVPDFYAISELEYKYLRKAASGGKDPNKYINLVSAQDGGMLIGTLPATIRYRFREDGSYSISGELIEPYSEDQNLDLVVRLTVNEHDTDTSLFTIKAGTKKFSVIFRDQHPEACFMENISMILVKP